MVIASESSPHKDLAISANPGGGFCLYKVELAGGVFILWLGMFDELTMWVVVVGFEHSIPWITKKSPGGRPSYPYCGFIPTKLQILWAWKV